MEQDSSESIKEINMKKLFITISLITVLLTAFTSSYAESLPGEIKSEMHGSGLKLKLKPAKTKTPEGTILLLPGGDYETLNIKNEGEKTANFLNSDGYDVAILEYHVAAGIKTRDMALADALKTFRLLKTKSDSLGLRSNRFIIMGFSSGGHLAARTVQLLGENEQPDDVILVSPSFMDETIPGTVFKATMPPLKTLPRLFATISDKENRVSIVSCQEYVKTWIGYDGTAKFILTTDSSYVSGKNTDPIDKSYNLSRIIKLFLDSKTRIQTNLINPAAIPVEGYSADRHAEKLLLVKKNKYDLILIGNSITNNFDKPEYQPVWNQFFAPRNALNLGYSGYRTENIIWNIQNGELEGQFPKVIVLEIGTNNVDEKNYPTRHTVGQLAGGIETIVKLIREKLPETKIIVLRCFPGCYGGPDPTSHRAILERASDIVSGLADNKHIFYCDVNHVFLNLDGSINSGMMPDWLHPGPAGAKAWAQAMEPLLSELMGDKSLDTEIPVNSAIVPASKIENDSYNWWDRHAEVLRIKDSINPEIVMIGNSITHYWGGEPGRKNEDGTPRKPNGGESWNSLFGRYRVLNMGFGWDRTQNVLWRLDHNELDGLHPRLVVINIGTNNTSQTKNARMNTAPEIVEGISSVVKRVRSKVPGARIILMAVFPREESASNPRRLLINEINRELAKFAKEQSITLVDISSGMLASDGTFMRGMTSDFCHPTEIGYKVWADALRPFLLEQPGLNK
jgi:lysophospholipase L1-like esterase/predicted esterase